MYFLMFIEYLLLVDFLHMDLQCLTFSIYTFVREYGNTFADKTPALNTREVSKNSFTQPVPNENYRSSTRL